MLGNLAIIYEDYTGAGGITSRSLTGAGVAGYSGMPTRWWWLAYLPVFRRQTQ